MNYSPFKIVYDLSSNPTKLNLSKFDDFIKNYPIEYLKINYPLFFNCLLSEIRKLSSISEDCVMELLLLLQLLPDLESSKILLIVFEELSTFIQNFIKKKSKNKSESFDYINVHLAINIIKIFDIILVKSENEKLGFIIYSSSGLVLLGYIVSFILFFIEYYKEREVQNEALSVLHLITRYDTSFLTVKANVVVNFAPGIFKSLIHVIQSDSKVGSIIKSKALKCFGDLIVLIFGDKSFKEGLNKLIIEDHSVKDLMEMIVERNDKWIKETWDKVISMIKLVKHSIISRMGEESWKVRLELTKISVQILEECTCVGSVAVDLIDCLITFNADVNTTVRETSISGLKKVAKMNFSISIFIDEETKNFTTISHSGVLLLSSVVKNNLENVVDSLKSIASTLTDDDKCNALQMLNGYLQIYGNQSLRNFDSVHLRNILDHLITFCALDYKHIDLLEGVRPLDFDTSLDYNLDCDLINKHFVYFHSSRVYDLIRSIITNIVKIVQPTLIFSVLFSLNNENQENAAQILFLSRLIISSLCHIDSVYINEKVAVCRTLLTTYFDPDILNIPTSDESYTENPTTFWKQSVASIEDKNSSNNIIVQSEESSTASLKKNTLILSLVMEICAACSVCLSGNGTISEDTENWMMRTCLFEVMSKVQQRPYVLSQSACQTLHILSLIHNKYEKSLSSLLRVNGDYIMDSVTRRLRANSITLKKNLSDTSTLSRLQSTCRCLITLCQHSDVALLPFMTVILDQLLFCLDITNGYGQHTFMVVLQEMIKAVIRWSKTSLTAVLSISNNVEQSQSNPMSNSDVVRSFMLDRDDILISSGLRKSIKIKEVTPELEESTQEDNQTKPVSDIIKIICKIMDRCIHMSSSSSPKLRLTCLKIINDTVFALQMDKDNLSKVVHQLWAPLEHRFSDKEFTVILAAYELLNTISQLCGGFLLIKIRTSLVSKLCILLENCAKISITPTTSLKYTGLYKLQISLIRFISYLVVRTGLEGTLLEDVVDVFLLYLDDRQPSELIEACLKSMMQLISHSPGLIWFKISQILPRNDACPVYGHVSRTYDKHFYVNSEKLLEFFFK